MIRVVIFKVTRGGVVRDLNPEGGVNEDKSDWGFENSEAYFKTGKEIA